MVSLSAALNAISSHAACTAIFIAAMAAVGFILGAIPTLSRITWIGWVGLIALMASLLTLTISVGVQDRPADAPQPPLPWTREMKIVGKPSFTEAMAAISSVRRQFFIRGDLTRHRLHSRTRPLLASRLLLVAQICSH